MNSRFYSDRQEKQIAKKVSGRVQPNSGGTAFGGGDVLADDILIEAKTTSTKQNSMKVRLEWVEKAKEQAFEQGRTRSAVALRFNPDENKDYYIITDDMLSEYLSLLKQVQCK